jgi:hypothetical protein
MDQRVTQKADFSFRALFSLNTVSFILFRFRVMSLYFYFCLQSISSRHLSLGAAIDHEESPRTMLGVDISMLTAGIIGIVTMPWEESYSISKNNVYGRAV